MSTRVEELHEQLAHRVAQLVSGEDWRRFLSQCQRLHRYSAGNRMLIAAQLMARGHEPVGVTASYRTWQQIQDVDGHACQVRRGEQALWINAPIRSTRREIDPETSESKVTTVAITGFRPVAVFHQSQLANTPALIEPPLPELLQGDDAPALVREAIEREIRLAGFQLRTVDRERGTTWNGMTDFAAREVLVQSDLPPVQSLKTLAHEWAHIALDHPTHADSRGRAEVEAESVAYLLMGAVGIDAGSYTIPYVAAWADGDLRLVRETAERVLATGTRLLERIQVQLDVTLERDSLATAPRVGADRSDPETLPGSLTLAQRRLTPDEQQELLGSATPERVALLLAWAGYTAEQTAQAFKDLGAGRDRTRIAMTSIHPYEALDLRAAPLYPPDAVDKALDVVHGQLPPVPRPDIDRGLALVDRWLNRPVPPSHSDSVALQRDLLP